MHVLPRTTEALLAMVKASFILAVMVGLYIARFTRTYIR